MASVMELSVLGEILLPLSSGKSSVEGERIEDRGRDVGDTSGCWSRELML